MSDRTITVYDIAKESGVSPATVSRVLTNNARVSEEKKKRVQEIIKKYDFEPNGLARSLSKQETKTIGMIVPDIRNPFYSTICMECEIAAARIGYNMILCNTMNDIAAESGHLRNLYEKRVDAIIQVGGSVDEVHPDAGYIELVNKIGKKIPIVIAGEMEGKNSYRVASEQTHGMKELIPYLIGLGHRDMALVGGRDTVIPTAKKRIAMKQILTEKGIPYHEEYTIDGDYSIESGYEGMQKLFSLGKLPSVIIAINDFSAMGIVKAISEHGLRIPEDISIVGYDDTYFSEMLEPQLTSINYNLKVYSEMIIKTIMNIIGNEKEERSKWIDTYLTVRNSCRNLNN